MARCLSQHQLDQYRREGFTFPVSVLSSAQARANRAACDELEVRLGGKPRTIQVRQMHLHFPWAWELASHPAILDAAQEILGPDLVIWATELFAKHAQDPSVSIGWHRDRPYMGLAGDGVTTTAWVALSDSSVANGCMCALPLDRPQPREDARPPADMPVVQVILRAGEMSLHNADVLHGSAPNTSPDKRVGFVIRFANPDARPLEGKPPMALVRGRVPHGRFELVDPPSPADAELALASMKNSAASHFDAVLRNLKLSGK
jgi:ectoine hydroxylase-related dioxygenase (phytanoyl-CoA dioxygenase family)